MRISKATLAVKPRAPVPERLQIFIETRGGALIGRAIYGEPSAVVATMKERGYTLEEISRDERTVRFRILSFARKSA